MSRRPSHTRLPTRTQLFWAPERAILFALDASLIVAMRALKAAHPMLDDPEEQPDHEPILSIAQTLLATARGLHELIVGYDDLADSLTRLDGRTPAIDRDTRGAGEPNPGGDPF